jgi:glycosyltransferase involved in cell wall biosynthesis
MHINNNQKNHEDIFFTIVIPTRERSDTLIYTLSSVLSQDYDNFEILVSDNFSFDGTQEKIRAISNKKLKYINTGKRISMSENWEFALDHIDHGWVTILGDDDALLPGALRKINQIVKETNTYAVRSNVCAYSWPSLNGTAFGSLDVTLKRGYEVRESRAFLQKVIDGRLPYTELPVLYNGGFVSTELIRRAKSITGSFFQSMTPDVYSSIVFSYLTDFYIYSYEPLAINGASIHSGGTAGFEKIKRERLYDPVAKFWSENNIPFHPDLPLLENGRTVVSISVVFYEAFLQANKFHHLKSIQASHRNFIRVTLMQYSHNHFDLLEWAKRFCIRHEINFNHVRPSRGVMVAIGIIRSMKVKFYSLYTYSMRGNTILPIGNVEEAALIAAVIKEIKPSIIKRISEKLKNKMLR